MFAKVGAPPGLSLPHGGRGDASDAETDFASGGRGFSADSSDAEPGGSLVAIGAGGVPNDDLQGCADVMQQLMQTLESRADKAVSHIESIGLQEQDTCRNILEELSGVQTKLRELSRPHPEAVPFERTPMGRTPLRTAASAFVPRGCVHVVSAASGDHVEWATEPPAPAQHPCYKMPKALGKRAAKEAGRSAKAGFIAGSLTTVMLQNVPYSFSRDMLLDVLDAKGFSGLYNFVYLPIDFETLKSVGYSFVNLVSPSQAQRLWQEFESFSWWASHGGNVCNVSWSVCQGLDLNVARYRNSPIMGEMVPDDYKPALFSNGSQVPFPPPTRRLKEPRLRGHKRVAMNR